MKTAAQKAARGSTIFGFALVLGFVFAQAQLASQAFAANDPTLPVAGKIIVGVHDKPPYAMQNKDGSWEGLGVTLWEAIAAKQKLEFEYQELPFEELINALVEKRVDIVIGELMVNPKDEQVMDFSQPFLEANIIVAVAGKTWHPEWWQILLHAFDWSIVQVFLSLVPALIIVSLLIWLVERHRPDGYFGGRPVRAIGNSFWFSAVTLTSTGYGDKVPVTFLGRALATLWMLISLLLVTAFTASVASTVASVRTGGLIRSVGDLQHFRNGVLNGGVAQQILEKDRAPTVAYEKYEEALQQLLDGNLDTVVGDSLSLKYLVRTEFAPHVALLPLDLFFGRVAFGLHQSSERREEFNIALLEELRGKSWQSAVQNYLGSTLPEPAED